MLSIPRVLLGIGWGALAALPLAARAQRVALAERLGVPARGGVSRARSRLVMRARAFAARASAASGPVGRVVGSFGRRRRGHRHDVALDRELPIAIDLLGVAVGAGCTPYLAVEITSRW